MLLRSGKSRASDQEQIERPGRTARTFGRVRSLPSRRKELAEQPAALLCEQATGHVGAMVQTRLTKHVEHAPARSRLRIAGPIDHARDTRQHDRAGTHGAGLERDVDDSVENTPASNGLSGLP